MLFSIFLSRTFDVNAPVQTMTKHLSSFAGLNIITFLTTASVSTVYRGLRNRPPMMFSANQNCLFALTFNFDWRIK